MDKPGALLMALSGIAVIGLGVFPNRLSNRSETASFVLILSGAIVAGHAFVTLLASLGLWPPILRVNYGYE